MRHGLPLLILVVVAACGTTQALPPAKELPTAPVVTLSGEATDLRATLRGKVALVSLWATWCEGCAREFDALNRLSASTASLADARVVGVDVGEPRETVLAFAKEHGLRYALMVDEDFHFADALGERRVPKTLVVDRAGNVVYRGEALDEEGLDAFRRALSR